MPCHKNGALPKRLSKKTQMWWLLCDDDLMGFEASFLGYEIQ